MSTRKHLVSAVLAGAIATGASPVAAEGLNLLNAPSPVAPVVVKAPTTIRSIGSVRLPSTTNTSRANSMAAFGFSMAFFMQLLQMQQQGRLAQQQAAAEQERRREYYTFLERTLAERHRHELQMLYVQMRSRGYTDEQIDRMVAGGSLTSSITRSYSVPDVAGSGFVVPRGGLFATPSAPSTSLADWDLTLRGLQPGQAMFEDYCQKNELGSFRHFDAQTQFQTIRAATHRMASTFPEVVGDTRWVERRLDATYANGVTGCQEIAAVTDKLLVACSILQQQVGNDRRVVQLKEQLGRLSACLKRYAEIRSTEGASAVERRVVLEHTAMEMARVRTMCGLVSVQS